MPNKAIGRIELQSKERGIKTEKKGVGLRGQGAARGQAQAGQEHHSALAPKSQTCIHQIISSSFHISPCLSACNLASSRLITYIQRRRQRILLYSKKPREGRTKAIPRSSSQEPKRERESTKTHKLTHGRILLLPPCTPRIVSRSMSRPSDDDDPIGPAHPRS